MSLREEDRALIVAMELEGAFYSQMQSMRERADYNCYYDVTETEIVERLKPTSQLIEKIKEYIGKK